MAKTPTRSSTSASARLTHIRTDVARLMRANSQHYGPTWIGVNWFVYKGLVNYGFNDIAERVKDSSLKLIKRSGFREYYHPHTGEGLGAPNFTWGGLVLDMC